MSGDVPIWLSAAEADPHEAALLAKWWANVPSRRQCSQCPKKATAPCGCCCAEHDNPEEIS